MQRGQWRAENLLLRGRVDEAIPEIRRAASGAPQRDADFRFKYSSYLSGPSFRFK